MDSSTNDLPLFDDDALIKRVASAEGKLTWDQALFSHTSRVLTSAIDDAFRANQLAFKTAYGFEPDALHVAYDINIFKFSAAKSIANIYELNAALRQARSFAEFQASAKTITGTFNGAWLQSEYQTANAVATNSAAYHRLMAQAEIFPYWQYVTVNDGKVREEHEQLHNLILPCSDPIWAKIYPPNGWRCRCRVTPKLRHEKPSDQQMQLDRKRAAEFMKSKEWSRARKDGFAINRAIKGEVFTENQMYIKKFNQKLIKDVNDETLSLPTPQQNRAKADTVLQRYMGTSEQWAAANKKDGVITLIDYKGRALKIDTEDFDHHIQKKENRVQYLEALKETTLKPSEVWVNAHETKNDFRNVVFIRFYKDETLVVLGKIDNKGSYRLATWFRLHEEKRELVKKYRSGILVKK